MQIRQLNQQGIGIPSNNVPKFIHWPKDPKDSAGMFMSVSNSALSPAELTALRLPGAQSGSFVIVAKNQSALLKS
jgi:hypothetical protein